MRFRTDRRVATLCSVVVEVELNQDRVTVTLTDDGTPFDPFSQPEPDTTLSVEERPIGGLGIHLVREMMDDVSYQRRDGHNVVVATSFTITSWFAARSSIRFATA